MTRAMAGRLLKAVANRMADEEKEGNRYLRKENYSFCG